MDLLRLLAVMPTGVDLVLAVYCFTWGLARRSRNEGSDKWGCE